MFQFILSSDPLDECLVNSTTGLGTRPCDSADSSGQTWSGAIINDLSLTGGGQLQWTRYVRRRIIRWTQRNVLDSNTSACVSVKELASKREYETILRPCDYKLPYICQKGDGDAKKIMTSSLPTITSLPTERPKNTTSSNGETGSLSLIVGLVIGGAVFLPIIGAFVVIILLKRRAKSKPQKLAPTTEHILDNKLAVKREQRSSQCSPQNKECDTTSNTMIESTNGENGKMVLTSSEYVYNHTWDKPVIEQQSDIVYSTTRAESEYDYSYDPDTNRDVYNHIRVHPITNQLTDHVYSTSRCNNDASLYDHTDSRKSN